MTETTTTSPHTPTWLDPNHVPTDAELIKAKKDRIAAQKANRELIFEAMFEPLMEAMSGGNTPIHHFDRDRRIYDYISAEGRSHNKVVWDFFGVYYNWIKRDAHRLERYRVALESMAEMFQFRTLMMAEDAEEGMVDTELLNFKFKVFTKFMAWNNEKFMETKKNIVENTFDLTEAMKLGMERADNRPQLRLVQGVTIDGN